MWQLACTCKVTSLGVRERISRVFYMELMSTMYMSYSVSEVFVIQLCVFFFCFSIGYKPFLNKLRGQIETLNKIIEQAPSRSHLASTSSTESGAGAEVTIPPSPELDQSAEEESLKTDNEQEEEQPSDNCTIS